MVSVIFHLLITDLTVYALAIAPLPELDSVSRFLIRRMVVIPRTAGGDWDFVSNHQANFSH